jgi:hypothetical protein
MKTVRKPRWYLIPVRVVLVTFVITLLSFALCLLLGISGVAVTALIRGVHPDMRLAYRDVAAPGALIIAACVFATMLVIEIKRFRQTRTLDGIARASR